MHNFLFLPTDMHDDSFLWIFLSLSVQAPYFLSWASGSLGLMALAWHLLVRSLPMFKPNL